MKKKIKIIALALIILIFANMTISNAGNSDIMGTAKNWIDLGKSKQSTSGGANWSSFNDLAGMLWGAGIFVIVIIGGILGIKYMFSSLEEKANIKESILPFILGAIIILGALTIWKLSVELVASIN